MFPLFSSHFFRLLAGLLLNAFALSSAHALDPKVELPGYRHERWGETDGAPSRIDALAQTEDGWLWVAGRHAGLYRFDGVRFIPFATSDGSRPQNVGVSAMRPGKGKELWIGHGAGGLSVVRGQGIRHVLTPGQTDSVFAIAYGPDDTVWVATGRGLYRIRNDVGMRLDAADGYESKRSEYVMVDSQGRVWSADGAHLYVMEAGSARFRKVRSVEVNPMLIESPDGSVWLVIGKHFERLTPALTSPRPMRSAQASTYQSGFDRDGNLWSGNCPVGLCVLRPGAWKDKASFDALGSKERLDQPWQMSSLIVLSVFVDREGNLWVGTAAGLDRFRDQPVHMLGDSLDRGTVHALPHPDGRIMVVESKDAFGPYSLFEVANGKLVRRENPLGVQVMARARDGSLVLAGSRGIERHYADRVVSIPLPPVPLEAGKSLILLSAAANRDELWLRIGRYGTWRFFEGKWERFRGKSPNGPNIAIDKSGKVYLNGFSRLVTVTGDTLQEIDVANSGIGSIQRVYAGEEVIVSGSGGTGVVKDGKLQLIHLDAGRRIGAISGVARDGKGAVWLNSASGLLRLRQEDWQRAMRDPATPLKPELLDALDGYVGGGEALRLNDTAFFADDGRLWLAGERGLAWLDPGDLRPNRIAANVDILGLNANGHRWTPGTALKLGPGAQSLQIEYASPSLRLPQRVRFHYRMTGADSGWVDAGTRRTAFYQNLAPGDYTFEVMAFNEDGVSSPEVSTLAFQVTPHPTQTWWFYTLCAALAVALLLVLYRMRLRRLAARLEERFEIRASERESIARALHDTFLQSLQGLFFSMQAVMSKLPSNSAARIEFDRLLERARGVLAEGRDEVKGLRSAFGSGEEFWEVLRRDISLIVPGGWERVELSGADGIDALQPQIHHNVYAVVREAIVNALRHTGGAVAVHALSGPREFVLSVADTGPGLGPHKAGKHGHFGLQGMREHASQVGGRLDIEDLDAGGARVTLAIPSRRAYLGQDKALRAG